MDVQGCLSGEAGIAATNTAKLAGLLPKARADNRCGAPLAPDGGSKAGPWEATICSWTPLPRTCTPSALGVRPCGAQAAVHGLFTYLLGRV